MKKIHPLLLSLLGGLLLYAAWPISPFTLFIFIAFVPLLQIAKQVTHRSRFFGWAWLTLFIWNAGTTWWTCNSTIPGGIAAMVANSLLMCIPWIGFYNIKRTMGERTGYVALVLFWLVFEFIHLNWELSWPWLTLGNAFATKPGWVQWYEFSGVAGGSFWILSVNILIFCSLPTKQVKSGWPKRRHWLPAVSLLAIPFFISYFIGIERDKMEQQVSASRSNLVAVQPNINPWEKWETGQEEMELHKLIRLTVSHIDSATVLVLWPETAVPVRINEDSIRTSYFMQPVWDLMKKYPKINLLTGEEGFRFLDEQHKTAYSTKIPGTNHFADAYNSAVLLDSSHYVVYHKSKLVPGVETIPSFLHFMDSWFEKFGGATGSYASQDERTVMATFNHSYFIAPAICYESIYGEFMSRYVRNGANVIAVITNDGWWGNTAGYRQHENYGRLRAIETRRWVVRSANTGISCFITPTGRVLIPQPWDTETAIKMNVPARKDLTFYVRHGDWIFRGACIGAICLLLWNLMVVIQNRRKIGTDHLV